MTAPIEQDGRRLDRPDVPRTGRRRKRWIIAAAVLLGVLTVADFGLASLAEHEVSQQARQKLNLRDDPSVAIHGFPFLPQAISGGYGHITIYSGGVHLTDTLREVALNVELRDVRAPLSDLAGGNTDSIRIGKLDGEAKIQASDIGRLAKINDLKIEPSPEEYVRNGSPQQIEPTTTTHEKEEEESNSTAGLKMQGKVDIAGLTTEITAYAVVELDGRSIKVTPHRLQFGNAQGNTIVPPEVQRMLMPQFGVTISPGALPFDVRPTGVRAEKGFLVLKGESRDVAFSGNRPPR